MPSPRGMRRGRTRFFGVVGAVVRVNEQAERTIQRGKVEKSWFEVEVRFLSFLFLLEGGNFRS